MATGDECAVIEAKRQLRAEAKLRRAALSFDERAEAAAKVALGELPFIEHRSGAVVSGFLAIGEELNPGPLMQRLRGEGFGIALPVMVGKGQPLEFRAWSPGDPLRTVAWGIREPGETATVLQPDVMIVPLLAFDRRGHRLGYGGGFYDRSISQLRGAKAVVTVGIGFANQAVDAVPHLDYDERLDWILTPEGPFRCR